MTNKSDYSIYDITGKLIIRSYDVDRIPFSKTGIYIIRDNYSGKTIKLAIY